MGEIFPGCRFLLKQQRFDIVHTISSKFSPAVPILPLERQFKYRLMAREVATVSSLVFLIGDIFTDAPPFFNQTSIQLLTHKNGIFDTFQQYISYIYIFSTSISL